jgi:D-beta-D-heptose 7-phosphate kinase/D-beta-D-heptose 1-phosphate adenosyltransferase
MLDRYWWGSVDRISPEAPVPVVRLAKSESTAGGAANVAVNIAGLGAVPFLVGIIGDDREAEELKTSLAGQGISSDHLQTVNGRPTTVKTRVVAHSHHVVRVDHEHTDDIGVSLSAEIWEKIAALVGQADVVILSDYAKGMLSSEILSRVIEKCAAGSRPLLVDPKGRDYTKYSGATLLTPNKGEATHAAGTEDLAEAAQKIISDVKLESLIITQGEHGMTIYHKDEEPVNFPAMARKVYDVTGAGDTVISTLAVALGAGCDLPTAAKLANIAAGLVVEEVGTTSIKFDQLKAAAETGAEKIQDQG